MDDIRRSLPPEVQSLLRQIDQAVSNIPPTHSEQIVRELLADLHQKIAALYHSLPAPSLPLSDKKEYLRELRQELRDLELQSARLGINAPRELELRIRQLLDAIRGMEQQMKPD